jgi:ABC-type branched-subunit amino acid transport system substrate-binding protein
VRCIAVLYSKPFENFIAPYTTEYRYKALPIYEKRNLAMLSPTSSSSELNGKVFFRPIQSTTEAAKVYADYIKNNLSLNTENTDKLRIFYDKNKLYSNSLTKNFLKNFTPEKKKTYRLKSFVDLQK